MLDKLIIIILLVLFSTPCFSEDRISSYTDENGKTVYYGTNEKKPPAPPLQPHYPQTPQYHSPAFEYRDPVKQPNTTIHNNVSISKTNDLHSRSNLMNQPNFSSLSTSIGSIIVGSMLLLAFAVAISITLFILWLYALVDVLKNEFTGSNKVVWILLLILLAPIGTILYLIVGKNQKVQKMNHQESSGDGEVYIRAYDKPKI